MMASVPGQSEVSAVLAEQRLLVRAAVVFSIFVNLLMLTSPLFMLLVYDRVLTSQSHETLTALVMLISFLFVMMALLDLARARVMSRYAARVQHRLDQRVFAAAQRQNMVQTSGQVRPQALAELEALTRFQASPGFLALLDLPWVPVFLSATALFHPWLGLLALGGGACLVLVTLISQRGAAAGLAQSALHARKAELLAERLQADAEMVQALGMSRATFARWQQHRQDLAQAVLESQDKAALWSSIGRSFRLYLQSAILALAALLVLRGEVSGGAMVAASVLTGRALAPVDQLLAHWPILLRARAGRRALTALLHEVPPAEPRLPLPRPLAQLELTGLSIILPGAGKAGLKDLHASIGPGQALAVIGASGSGKTTLARALTGTLPIEPQMIRLGGAPLAAHGEALGRWIGYLPQKVQLFDGTIAENIAGLELTIAADQVIAAAQRAGIHQQILTLPQGYETRISDRLPQLSGGQIQRLALARALYGDPVLLVLDEPDSNLDHDGAEALSQAIRRAKADGMITVIMAHRPAAIRDCDLILLLEAGERRAFGPAAELLRAMLRAQSADPAAGSGPLAEAGPDRTDPRRTAKGGLP